MSSPIFIPGFDGKWKIKKVFFFLSEIPTFFFSPWQGKRLEDEGLERKPLLFLVCWPSLPTNNSKTLACAPFIPFLPKSTLFRVRRHCLKALRAIALKMIDLRLPQNESSEDGHCCMSQPAGSPQIAFGKSSITNLFLSHLFQCTYHCLFHSAVLQVHPDGLST